MRLIDVDVFANELKEWHENIMKDPEVSKRMKWCEAVHYGATTAIIEKMPTIEATPVVHGRWMPYTGADSGFHYCSECKKQAFNYDEGSCVVEVRSDFCPNCGAKMDGAICNPFMNDTRS